MKNITKVAIVASLIALGSVLVPPLCADAWNHLTKVTFSAPVEVPGQVLPAGTYWFKLLDSQSNRDIVQIYNAADTKQIALLLTLPDERLQPAGKTVITFSERAEGSPEALKAWFYPGDSYGQRFVYPKLRASQLAKLEKETVPSMPDNLAANTRMAVKSPSDAPAVALKNASVQAQQPAGGEANINVLVVVPAGLSPTP